MRIVIAIIVALAAAASAPADAQKRPERIRLTAASSNGAVLMRVPVKSFEYTLQFSRNGNSGFLSRVYEMVVRPGPDGYRYIARTLSPGRYRLDSIWQQGRWSACLEQGTIEIPVVAGRISYVGTLDPDNVLAWIQQRAIERGRTRVVAGDIVVSRPEEARPVVLGRDEAAVGEARQFADSVMNGTGDLLELAQIREAAFSTSGTGRAIKVCG